MKSRLYDRIIRALSPWLSLVGQRLAQAVRICFFVLALLFRTIRNGVVGGIQFIYSLGDEIRRIRLADWWREYVHREIAKMALCLWIVLGGFVWFVLPYGLGWQSEGDCPRRECNFLVDINAADWPELTLLPRIGPILSQRIVSEREKHGPFSRAEDLLRIRGIGPGILRGIQPFLKFPENNGGNLTPEQHRAARPSG
ncbi:MAG: helix-hairpin-helix domain-containing protein [Thermogutta sp.]|uniref:ComEA family DNA-binding protein n=1 Tax=Thermogutta sp. TaxID=1962930 RepID=UPI00199BCF37|nr:helix-hairpin-helix domain-containing protein [Thermogutta sp.]MBC7353605.1 helix-hairpin-helix domain-containing protein [Thermogutta sp.]